MASTEKKRKRVVLTIEEKVKVLDTLDKSVSYTVIAEKFGIGKSTVSDLKMNKEKIRSFQREMIDMGMKKQAKTMRLGDDKRLDQALYLWFLKAKAHGRCASNCDETGLNFRLLPDATLAGSFEKTASGRKKSKERVTLNLCSNASGTIKLPLHLIGKAKRPRCFRNMDMKLLPVKYTNKKTHG